MLNPLSLDNGPNRLIPGLTDAPGPAVLRLGGGGNSQVYLVEAEDGTRYVAKRYYRHPDDPRDRLGVEFQSLRFMWRHGLRSIPEPLAQDPPHDLAFYQYIPGRRPVSKEITRNDIDALTGFLFQLDGLKDQADAKVLPPASESCLSARAALNNLFSRLNRLEAADAAGSEHLAMKTMIRRDFRPLLQDTAAWLERALPRIGWDPDGTLPQRDQTLSPSDYGFHNALRLDDGRLVFIDFEYFGWDDPAKMILDFLLHPAMEIGSDLKRYFLHRMLDRLDQDGRLSRRIGFYQSLMGLKWVLILLNEFLKCDYGRRQFAGAKHLDRSALLAVQLEKAQAMLAWARGVYGKTDPAF